MTLVLNKCNGVLYRGIFILTSLIFQQIGDDVFVGPHLIIVIEDRKLFEHLNRVRILLGHQQTLGWLMVLSRAV